MKTIKLTLFLFFAVVSVSFAQQKTVDKAVIKTPTVLCEDCQTRLEDYIRREPGIASVKVDYRKKITTITYLTDRNNIEQLKTAISNAGFDADDITADEEAYKKLPKCCRSGDGKRPTVTTDKPLKTDPQ